MPNQLEPFQTLLAWWGPIPHLASGGGLWETSQHLTTLLRDVLSKWLAISYNNFWSTYPFTVIHPEILLSPCQAAHPPHQLPLGYLSVVCMVVMNQNELRRQRTFQALSIFCGWMQFSLSRDVAFGLASWWKAASGTLRHQQGCCWQTSLPSSETKKRSKKVNSSWPLMTIEETACCKTHGFKSCVSSILFHSLSPISKSQAIPPKVTEPWQVFTYHSQERGEMAAHHCTSTESTLETFNWRTHKPYRIHLTQMHSAWANFSPRYKQPPRVDLSSGPWQRIFLAASYRVNRDREKLAAACGFDDACNTATPEVDKKKTSKRRFRLWLPWCRLVGSQTSLGCIDLLDFNE